MRADFAGARSLLRPEKGLALNPARWGFQIKRDGLYSRIATDHGGIVREVTGSTGHPVPAGREFLGMATGIPDAVLYGELDAGTEAGRRAAQLRGYACAHLFDVAQLGDRYVGELGYAERYAYLHRGQASVECYSPEVARSDSWWFDARDMAHDIATGRFVRPLPSDLRRFPIIPLMRGRGAGEALWREAVEVGGAEGLVACDLLAPLGARSAKRKIKQADTLDCVVVQVEARHADVLWRGHRFTVSARGDRQLHVGEIVEVVADGFYEAGTKRAPRVVPRFARLVRVREDKAL